MRNLRTLNALYYDAEKCCSVCIFTNETVEDPRKPAELIDHWCIHCGSTRKGRKDAFRTLTGTVQKTPVLISSDGPILMPTLSPESDDCVWISYDTLLRMKPAGADTTTVEFLDGTLLKVDVNIRVLRNQTKRCDRFRRILEDVRNHPEDLFTR